MARPNRIDCSREDAAIEAAKRQCGIDDVGFNGINLYCYNIMVPLEVGDEKAEEFANCVFHAVGVLDESCDLGIGEGSDFCEIILDDEMECYCVIFNHHLVTEKEELHEYSVAALREGDEENEDKEAAQVMQLIAEGIKSGALRSKSGEGYFVLKGEYYDANATHTTSLRTSLPRRLQYIWGRCYRQ